MTDFSPEKMKVKDDQMRALKREREGKEKQQIVNLEFCIQKKVSFKHVGKVKIFSVSSLENLCTADFYHRKCEKKFFQAEDA